MKGTFPIDKFRELRTPFYYYDTKVLRDTLSCVRAEAAKYGNFEVHYAVKANANPKVLSIIRENGLGADCVSGGEVRAAVKAGFPTNKIVFAGVGKSDWEINQSLDYNIFCFNVESIPELECLIRTKFQMLGISREVILKIRYCLTVGMLIINTQSTAYIDMLDADATSFQLVLQFIHTIAQGNEITHIQYLRTNVEMQSDKLRSYQTLHFELGRAITGQCGSLISQVLYVKQGANKKFAILDAGMTDLIRPALYQAYHKIENITSEDTVEAYDVVGPICESSDVFGKAVDLNRVKRGDLIALRSAGAYGEIMASSYNCRELPQGYTSDELV